MRSGKFICCTKYTYYYLLLYKTYGGVILSYIMQNNVTKLLSLYTMNNNHIDMSSSSAGGVAHRPRRSIRTASRNTNGNTVSRFALWTFPCWAVSGKRRTRNAPGGTSWTSPLCNGRRSACDIRRTATRAWRDSASRSRAGSRGRRTDHWRTACDSPENTWGRSRGQIWYNNIIRVNGQAGWWYR